MSKPILLLFFDYDTKIMIFHFSPPEVALLLSSLFLSSSMFLFNVASSLAISRRILGMVFINLVSKTVISLIPFNNTKIV